MQRVTSPLSWERQYQRRGAINLWGEKMPNIEYSAGIDGVQIVTLNVFDDERGQFRETFRQEWFPQRSWDKLQSNMSQSRAGVLRGLHYQHPAGQGKLEQVLKGEVLDVAVDIRLGSPTFGKGVSCVLSGENHRQFYVPAGFAHGFCVLSETSLFSYKCMDFYNSQRRCCV